ncbi:MAG: hypothetical protein OHM56_07625 [Spiroplasma phoeniceum]|nr:MAG: hypothetical protein OHM56_07625 [Spiroplasma phoeniceum]
MLILVQMIFLKHYMKNYNEIFSENIKVLDDSFKKSLKEFPNKDENFKDMDISYNNVSLFEKSSNRRIKS